MGKGRSFQQMIEDFSAAGYRVVSQLLNAVNYGVPQLRERVFLIGVRNDIDFVYRFPPPTRDSLVTLEDSIRDLEENPGPYATGGFSSIYMSRNRKKKWSEPSFTIQASARQAPLHPSGHPMEKIDRDQWIIPNPSRRLSVREIARIQTFPDDFHFHGTLDQVYKQIGNAVPILLAKAVMTPIVEWVTD